MFSSTILGTGLALLASTQLVAAQSLNLTLTFYPEEDNTCSGDDSKAISFTTSSYPVSQSCFNLDEIFTRNSTGGIRNQSSSTITAPNDQGIRWAIINAQAWDPTGNYSHVKYEQLNTLGKNEDDDATYASRRVNIYNGEDCLQVASSNGEDVAPWFGWTCHSSSDDNCRTSPFNIKSFIIIPIDDDDRDGKCLDFAEEGVGARSFPGTFGPLISAIAVGFFLL